MVRFCKIVIVVFSMFVFLKGASRPVNKKPDIDGDKDYPRHASGVNKLLPLFFLARMPPLGGIRHWFNFLIHIIIIAPKAVIVKV